MLSQSSIPNLVSKKQNSILGALFYLIFMVLHDNWSENIGDGFLKFDCIDMWETFIWTYFHQQASSKKL